MFGQNSKGSNDPQNKNSNDKKVNLSEDDFQIDEMPIHTMRKDLAELKNPTSKKIAPKPETLEKKSLFAQKSKVATLENSGPFFQKEIPKTQELPKAPEKSESYPSKIVDKKAIKQEDATISFNEKPQTPAPIPPQISPKEISDIPTAAPPKIVANNINKKEVPKAPENKIETPSHGIGKAIIIAVMIFIIIIAGAGGYYFWMTRIATLPEEVITTEIIESENEIEDETTIQATPAPTLSLQNSNYLTITADSQETKEILDNYSTQVLATNTPGLFEFLITDTSNTPITFKEFTTILNLDLSPDVLSQVGADFSFYIYNYGDKTRFGLSMPIIDSIAIKSSLLINEAHLIQELAPLYSEIEYTLPLTAFATATYTGAPEAYIRYLNITTSEDLSLDYILLDDQLIVGTTKSTAYAILDKQIKNSTLLAE